MPVIVPQEKWSNYLSKDENLGDITQMLKPYPAKLMNAYPVSPDIKKPGNNSRELIEPIGERVRPEHENVYKKETQEHGPNKRKREKDNIMTISELAELQRKKFDEKQKLNT